jgi:hypothetical protein
MPETQTNGFAVAVRTLITGFRRRFSDEARRGVLSSLGKG